MTNRAPDDGDAALGVLMAKISREHGFRCASYKEQCVRRRIATRMRARGVHDYPAYARLLDADPVEQERLIDALTINVTKLFRNREVWTAIAEHVIPELWGRSADELRVWSAGTASGEEAHSLAILFHQHAMAAGELHRLDRVRVVGTDIDRTCLAMAERGAYPASAFAETPPETIVRYFRGEEPRTVVHEVARHVTLRKHDLIADPFPEAQHLIMCRNVTIYFGRETQEALLQSFHDALAPGGFLVLGKVETLIGPARQLFSTVCARERIFRRRS